MSQNNKEELSLQIERIVPVPANLIWKAWTTPSLIKQWFAPKPWTVSEAMIELKPGGCFRSVMKSPEGQEFPGDGCILEVIENKKLVWTDALKPGFAPNEQGFMTAMIILEEVPGGTKYIARALHKNLEDKKKHEEMGFVPGWNQCLDQLVELMKKEM